MVVLKVLSAIGFVLLRIACGLQLFRVFQFVFAVVGLLFRLSFFWGLRHSLHALIAPNRLWSFLNRCSDAFLLLPFKDMQPAVAIGTQGDTLRYLGLETGHRSTVLEQARYNMISSFRSFSFMMKLYYPGVVGE